MAVFTTIGLAAGAAASAAFAVGLQIAVTVASVGYQMYQSKKMKKAAAAAAEARKGKEVVTEGQIVSLPIVYGRAKIGGSRAWINTKGSFESSPIPTSDKVFATNFQFKGTSESKSRSFTINSVGDNFTTVTNTFNLPSDSSLYNLEVFLVKSVDTPEGIQLTDYPISSINLVAEYGNITANSIQVRLVTPEGVYQNSGNFKITARIITSNVIPFIKGSKNEFLFQQQALCVGPISAVKDIIFDDSRFIDNPDIQEISKKKKFQNGFRIDAYYNGNVVDSIVSSNFSERLSASFPEMAYISAVFDLDRDEPQWNDPPVIQCLIEGRKVKTLDNTLNLSNERVYSNNPAYCLLDYLLDNRNGANLSLNQVDLESFKNAADICDTVVRPDTKVAGKIWQPTDKVNTIQEVDLKLYECNIIIDTEETIRDNVEAILQTMGDARLVWVQGKYRLVLQYPETNEEIEISASLTDDDLVIDDEITIGQPNAQEKLNHLIIKYADESNNFKESTVSWPPKFNGVYKRGIGGVYYPPQSGWSGDKSEGESFLNNFAVWQDLQPIKYKFSPYETRTDYILEYTGDNNINISLFNVTLNQSVGSWTGSNRKLLYKINNLSLNSEYIYEVTISGTSRSKLKGLAARLFSQGLNIEIWSTRNQGYTDFINIPYTNNVYTSYLAEDNNIELEDTIYYNGCTDYYHALAKAEETVRTSRSAAKFKFKYIIKNRYFTPGDIIQLSSEQLNLGLINPLYIKIDEVSIVNETEAQVQGTRFDFTQLAWNVDDEEVSKAAPLFNFSKVSVNNIEYFPESNILQNTSGILTWEFPSENTISHYVVLVHSIGDVDEDGELIFNSLGNTQETQYVIPALTNVKEVIFRVGAVYQNNSVAYEDSFIFELTPNREFVDLEASTLVINYELLDDQTYSPNPTEVSFKARSLNTFDALLYYRLLVNNTVVSSGASSLGEVDFSPYSVPTSYFSIPIQVRVEISRDSNFDEIVGVKTISLTSVKDGVMSALPTIYQWTSGTTPARPSNGTYTWLTGTISAPNNGWTTSIPSNTNKGWTLWSITIPLTAGTSRTTSPLNWTNTDFTIKAVSTNGIDGLNGAAGADGAAGVNARSVDLTSTSQVIEYNSANARVGPASITLTATPQNLAATAFYRFYINDVAQGSGPTTTSTFTYTTPTTYNSTPVKFEVEVREGLSTNPIVARDQLSVYSVKPGANSISALLTNEAHTLSSDSAGNNVNYTGSGTSINTFDGINALTYETGTGFPTTNGRFRVTTTSSGITVGAFSGSGTTTATVGNHSNMTADTATITYTINARSLEGVNLTVTKIQSLTKSRQGVMGAAGADGSAGINARSVNLTSTAQVIEYNSANARVGPTSITLTATPQNLAATAFYRFYINDVAQGSGPTTTNTFSYTTPTTYSSTPIKFEVEIREGGSTNPIVARDQLSVYSVKPGANVISALLSNESHTLSSDSAGNNVNYTGSGTGIIAFDGTTSLIYETGTGFPTTNGRFRIATSASSITVGAISGSGTIVATVGNHSNMTADNVIITYTINARSLEGVNLTVTKIQSLTKSRQGATGATGSTGAQGNSIRLAFARVSSGIPVAGTVTTSGNTTFPPGNSWGLTTSPVGWYSQDPNTSANISLYQTDGVYNPITNQTVWSTPYLVTLKVNTLEAITVNTGNLNATGDIRSGDNVNGVIMGSNRRVSVRSSSVERVRMGDLSGISDASGYGIVGFAPDGTTQNFRLDNNGLFINPTDTSLATFGSTKNYRLMTSRSITIENTGSSNATVTTLHLIELENTYKNDFHNVYYVYAAGDFERWTYSNNAGTFQANQKILQASLKRKSGLITPPWDYELSSSNITTSSTDTTNFSSSKISVVINPAGQARGLYLRLDSYSSQRPEDSSTSKDYTYYAYSVWRTQSTAQSNFP